MGDGRTVGLTTAQFEKGVNLLMRIDRDWLYLKRKRLCCELCWESFKSEIDLLFHEAAEDEIYYLDGVGDQGPGGDNPGGSIQSKPHPPPSEPPQSDGAP